MLFPRLHLRNRTETNLPPGSLGEGLAKMATTGKLSGVTRGPAVAVTDEEKAPFRALWAVHDLFRETRPDMRVCGVSKSVMSRHLHDIGDADRAGKERA
jgi:hypothetical protein